MGNCNRIHAGIYKVIVLLNIMANCNDLQAPDTSEYECLWSSYSWIIWVLTSIAVLLILFSIGVLVYQRWKLIKTKSAITKQKILESISGKEHILWYESS